MPQSYTAVDPMVRLISMLGQDQQQEEENPDQTSNELMARLQQIGGGGTQTSKSLTPTKPTLGAPAARGVSGGNNQLAEIAKWGQYSMAPKPRPVGDGKLSPGAAGSDFERFIRAIAAQESGGRYGAVNRSSGALGKYQIMPGNVGNWSRAALGRRISANQFLHNPRYQEQIAQYMLRRYYQRYGARGAAEAWYGGPGSIGKGYVRGYSSSILRRMGL